MRRSRSRWSSTSATDARLVEVALTGSQLERARAWLGDGRPAAPPRPAATVMLVRDGDAGPEVFVQRRVASMAFAASMHVFPGGAVDDDDAHLPLGTPGLAGLAAALGVTPAAAAPRAAAAVREVEEECGVRVAVADLRARAHWVTPEFEPRRFDTWVLAARMPPGQVAHGASGESDASEWVRPADLLRRWSAGEARMLPPTVVSLEELARFGSAEVFLAHRPRIARVEPRLVERDDGTLVLRSVIP